MSPKLPRLFVLTDWSNEALLLSKLNELLPLGDALAVQHRHPGATSRRFFEEAAHLKKLCDAHGVPLFINGRLDIALLLKTHLHLNSGCAAVSEYRKHLPSDAWVSAAAHDSHELVSRQEADVLFLSPVFPAGSKTDDTRPLLGPEYFHALASGSKAPCYALGGIAASTASRLQAPGYAVISAIWKSEHPRREAEAILATVR